MIKHPDSRFYAKAAAEVEAGVVDRGLEAIAYVRSECEPAKTKAIYLTLRAEQLEAEAEAEAARKRDREQMERTAVWHQHRYKVVRRRSLSADPARVSTGKVRRSYPGLAALLSWVAR